MNPVIEKILSSAEKKAAPVPKMEDETWTIRPDDDVRSLMSKAINQIMRIAKKKNIPITRRGLRTQLLNEAFRLQNADLIGKREGNQKAA